MRACRRIQRARGHSQTGEVPGFVRRLRSPPFWQRSDVLYGGAHSYKAKYYGTYCGGLHFGHFRARRTARALMRSARVGHPCARHHSYGQADRRRPRPLTPCGPDSKRSPAARCLRTVGALSASVLFPGLAEPPGGSESTRSFPRERHLPRARCFPNVGRAAMASARPTTRISTWGRRLWCFSTSFGQGGFSDRREFPT